MEQLPKKQNCMVNPKKSETMKLGSLAVWWSPLIIVCPDRVYLSKLFLVLQSCPPWTLNNKKSESPCSHSQLPRGSGLWRGSTLRHAVSPWEGPCVLWAHLGAIERDFPDYSCESQDQLPSHLPLAKCFAG